MDKHTFFTQFHQTLAEKNKTTPHIVYIIRGEILGEKKTIEELLTFARKRVKIQRAKQTPSKRLLEKWLEVIKFLIRRPEDVGKLLVKTEFDR